MIDQKEDESQEQNAHDTGNGQDQFIRQSTGEVVIFRGWRVSQ